MVTVSPNQIIIIIIIIIINVLSKWIKNYKTTSSPQILPPRNEC